MNEEKEFHTAGCEDNSWKENQPNFIMQDNIENMEEQVTETQPDFQKHRSVETQQQTNTQPNFNLNKEQSEVLSQNAPMARFRT